MTQKSRLKAALMLVNNRFAHVVHTNCDATQTPMTSAAMVAAHIMFHSHLNKLDNCSLMTSFRLLTHTQAAVLGHFVFS